MKRPWNITLCSLASIALLLLAGCASGPKQQPLLPGAAAGAPVLEGKSTVLFSGDVKLQVVPYVDGMTLAQGLLLAEYTGYLDPRTITVTRAGIPYRVDVRRFLRGDENPELQPGDRVDVRR